MSCSYRDGHIVWDGVAVPGVCGCSRAIPDLCRKLVYSAFDSLWWHRSPVRSGCTKILSIIIMLGCSYDVIERPSHRATRMVSDTDNYIGMLHT